MINLTTGDQNTAVGYHALRDNTGEYNCAFGEQAMVANTSGNYNTGLGYRALALNTTGIDNVAIGASSLYNNTTGTRNTSLGKDAGDSITTGGSNVNVGYDTGQSNTTSSYNTNVGTQAHANGTGEKNTCIGYASGFALTTGSKNTILGGFQGNSGGLDIRTSNNNIVLSDGDGNPRQIIDSSGNVLINTTSLLDSAHKGLNIAFSNTLGGASSALAIRNTSTASGADASPPLIIEKSRTTTSSSARFVQFSANNRSTAMGGIVGNGASNVQFASISDMREKTNIQSISGSLNKIVSLNPVEFDWISTGEHVNAGFVAQEVELIFPEFVIENLASDGQEERKGLTGGMTGGIIAHLVKSIQELSAKVDRLQEEVNTLKGA